MVRFSFPDPDSRPRLEETRSPPVVARAWGSIVSLFKKDPALEAPSAPDGAESESSDDSVTEDRARNRGNLCVFGITPKAFERFKVFESAWEAHQSA